MRSSRSYGQHARLAFVLVAAFAALPACDGDLPPSNADATSPAVLDAGKPAHRPHRDSGAGDAPKEDAAIDAGSDATAEDAAVPDATAQDAAPLPTCNDGEQNGGEQAIDCGGPCRACITEPGPPPGPCFDHVQNGNETDIDCGGDCQPCEPTAGFTLSPASGDAPITVAATSTATPGNVRIVDIRYSWSDGTGTTVSSVHEYLSGGTYVVTQTVRDALGRTRSEKRILTLGGFQPARMSATDVTIVRNQADTADETNIVLTDDRLGVEPLGAAEAAVRSDQAIDPGSGVFYFEVERLTEELGAYGFGVATAAAQLDAGLGSSAESFGLLARGPIMDGYALCRGSTGFASVAELENQIYGFVVDYRGASPIVHVIASRQGVTTIECTADMSVSTPLYMLYSGRRAEVGLHARFNPGADTTNIPFHFQRPELRAALDAIGEGSAGDALVMGFGKTRALPADRPPSLTIGADVSVPLFTSVTVKASAFDPEEGDLSTNIEWTDRASLHHTPVRGFGGTFTFTPRAIGKHPLLVQVADKYGVTRSAVQTVTVTGSLPQWNPVRLVRGETSGEGAFTTDGGLSVYFEEVPHHFKDALRANQGIYHDFWYFEVHRHLPAAIGIGLVVADGSLNPYMFNEVPWSMSINTGAGVWHNLIGITGYDTDASDYGFAVDYRGDSPIVYLIVKGAVACRLPMPEVTVPLYPMTYGAYHDGTAAAPVLTFDFTPPFQFDPAAILAAAGYDTTGFELGWGDANTGGP